MAAEDPIEDLRSRVDELRREATTAEHESRELGAKVRLAERLVAEVGRVPRGWRLMAGFAGLGMAFWFGATNGLDVWWLGALVVLWAAGLGVSAGAEERRAWERLERARLEELPATRARVDSARHDLREPAEDEVEEQEHADAVSRRQHGA